jgi:hypothetical protein
VLEPELAIVQPGARFHFQPAYHEVPLGGGEYDLRLSAVEFIAD